MKTLIITAAAALVALSVTPASANSIRDRQYNQRERIERGYERGDLTRHEYRRLSRQQDRIARDTYYARRSGYGMSPYERRRIQERQARASQNIYRQRHDGQF